MMLKDYENKIFGSQKNKEQAKALAKMGFDTVKGMGKVLLSVPLIIDSPGAGLYLLKSGMDNMKPLFGNPMRNSGNPNSVSIRELRGLNKANRHRRKAEDLQRKYLGKYEKYNRKLADIEDEESARYKKYKKKITKVNNKSIKDLGKMGRTGDLEQLYKEEKAKKYKFNRFGHASLDVIRGELEKRNTERSIQRLEGIISRLTNPTLGVKVFSTPLRLSGQFRVAANVGNFIKRELEDKQRREAVIDRNYRVQLTDMMRKEYISEYNKQIDIINEKANNASTTDLLDARKRQIGQLETLNNGNKIQFGINTSSISSARVVDKIFADVALKIGVQDLSRLDLNNKDIQARVLQLLQSNGLIKDVNGLSEVDKKRLIKLLGDRKQILEKSNNDVVKKSFVRRATAQVANEIQANSIKDLKSEESKKKIEQKVQEAMGIEKVDEEEKISIKETIEETLKDAKILKQDEQVEYTKQEKLFVETRKYEPDKDTSIDPEKENALEIDLLLAELGEEKREEIDFSELEGETGKERLANLIEKVNSTEEEGKTSIAKSFLKGIMNSLKSALIAEEVIELNNAIENTENALDQVQTRIQENRETSLINPDEVISEGDEKYKDLLNKIIEQRNIELEAEEIGIRRGTKEHKKMQMIYEEQRDETVFSNADERLINNLFENLKDEGDGDKSENAE